MHVVSTFLVGRAGTDNGLATDQGRFVGNRVTSTNCSVDCLGIMPLYIGNHMPAICFKAFCGVVSEPAVGVTVNGNFVVIPECHQLAQAPGTGQCAGFMGNPFHHAAIAHEHVGVMVDNLMARLVEFCREQFFCHRHTHGIGDALAERTTGRFHAGGVAIFRMARCLGMHLTEALQFFDRQIVT